MFRAVWLATVVSNIGTWVSNVGTAWLMTSLAPSPVMVTLVQAATALPVFLFALPAGALADIVDRRRLLIVIQAATMLIAAALGIATRAGVVTPLIVLVSTFLLGLGMALSMPAFQAVVPDLVTKETLRPAIALNSVGINVARAIGPALGGVLIAAAGIASPFFLNAVSYLGVILVLARWKAPRYKRQLPAERLWSAIRTGVRFAREAPELKATLVRAIGFFVFASSYWALLPLIARERLAGGPETYGILLGCIGAGAVAGAFVLPSVRARVSPDQMTFGASLATVAVLFALAAATNMVVAVPALLIAGVAWVTILSTLNVSAQVALPAWVRARGLSVYLVVFNGGLALGSPLWGFVAGDLGISSALSIAAAALAVASVVTLRWRLPGEDTTDLAPSNHWPAPLVAVEDLDDRRGPVMVEIEYRIDPAHRDEFAESMAAMGRIRRRDGAIFWEHFEDVADPAHHVEVFIIDSWLQHLRQHERFTVADRPIQDRIHSFHVSDSAPHVTHLATVGGVKNPESCRGSLVKL
jgi:MFS family permease